MALLERHRIELLAGELAGSADQLRSAAARLQATAAALQWQSPAGTAFQTALGGLLGQAQRLGGRLDETARAVSAHGLRAARRADAMAGCGAERAVLGGAGRAARALGSGAGHALRTGIGRLVP